jgi:hypothetical protein
MSAELVTGDRQTVYPTSRTRLFIIIQVQAGSLLPPLLLVALMRGIGHNSFLQSGTFGAIVTYGTIDRVGGPYRRSINSK